MPKKIKIPAPKPKYRQKICIEPNCGNPFYVETRHFNKVKRCLPCQQYFKRVYNRDYQRKYRAKQAQNKKKLGR